MLILLNELENRGFTYRKTHKDGPHLRQDGLVIPVTRRSVSARMDASSRLAFGLCEEYGIDLPKGAEPADAWEALKEATGKDPSDFYNQSGQEGADKIRFSNTKPKKFAQRLAEAKAAQSEEDGWRVTGMTRQQLEEWHPGAKLHVTDGGSTIAIDKSGDIVGVCVGKGDGKNGLISGSTLLQHAVKNGGVKLDSYEGNHRFYVKNGFEPVSWCKWDRNYEDGAKAQGWNPDRDKRESIVFYRYVGKGKVKNTSLDDFYRNTPASTDYDTAYAERDKTIGKR